MMQVLRYFPKETPMRGLLIAGGLAALLTAGGPGAAKPAAGQDNDKTYDLRGPARKVGEVLVSSAKQQIKDADTTLKLMGKTINTKMSLVTIGEEEEKILAVDGRKVTKCQSRIIKDRVEITSEVGGDMTEPGELEGEVVISERTADGKWKHVLVDTKPTGKQKVELDRRNGIEGDDDVYPAEKVKVGHTWKVDAKTRTKMFDNSFTDVKGELKLKFVRVEAVGGEDCAVVECTGVVKAKMKDEEGEPNLDTEMDLKETVWRSLKTGVEVKETVEGKIKLSGKEKMDGVEVEIALSGTMTGEGTTKLKEPK
jgi:hypothetical protein